MLAADRRPGGASANSVRASMTSSGPPGVEPGGGVGHRILSAVGASGQSRTRGMRSSQRRVTGGSSSTRHGRGRSSGGSPSRSRRGRRLARLSTACPSRLLAQRCQPRATACAGSTGSTSQVFRASRSMRVPSGVTCVVWNRISDATWPVSASCVTVHAGGRVEGGRVTRDHGRRGEDRRRDGALVGDDRQRDPRRRVADPGGPRGWRAPASARRSASRRRRSTTRIRWPAANRQPVASTSTVSGTTTPGSSGCGSVRTLDGCR